MTADRLRSGGRTRLERQADDILDGTEDVVKLVAELELGHVQRDDRYADWHASTPLVPMVRALLLKELEEHSYSELHRRLSDNPDEAALLGLGDAQHGRPSAVRGAIDSMTISSR